MQNKLFTFSAIFMIAVIFSLYFFSQGLVLKLIIQKQIEFEIYSVNQVSSFVKSIVSSMDGYIETFNKSANIKDLLTSHYNFNDTNVSYDYLQKMENTINACLINKEYIDNIIVLGQNNQACVYTQYDTRFDTSSLNIDVDFMTFLNNSFLSQYLKESNYPFYYINEDISTNDQRAYEKLIEIINKKIIMVRQLKNEKGFVDGIIIISYKKSIIFNILHTNFNQQLLYFLDGKGRIIWHNENLKNKDTFDYQKLITSSSGSFLQQIEKEEYLFTYGSLKPYDFTVVSCIPIKSVLKNKDTIRFYWGIFGLCYLVLTLIISYFFSRNTCKRLESLAMQFSGNNSSLPSHIEDEYSNKQFNKLPFRTKIIIYFSITVIIPTIFLITLTTYLNYNVYKEKIIDITYLTTEQLKSNINFRLNSYNRISLQTIFDDNIQLFFDKGYKENANDLKIKVYNVFINEKIKNKELLSMSLYNIKGDNLYSTIYFDSLPATNISNNFLELMEKSSDQLVYLGTSKNYLENGPALLFARNINSNGINFGKRLGYIVFSIDQEAIWNVLKNMKLGDSGTFLLIDEKGDAITYKTDDPEIQQVKSINTSMLFNNKSNGISRLALGTNNYFMIYNSLDMYNINIVGIVPSYEIISKVYPLIWYSLGILFLYLLIIMFISIYISYEVIKPLKKLEALMEEIRNGNFNVHANYNGMDEIAVLTTNFNLMVDRLRQLVYENYQSKLRESELMFLEKEAQLNALQQQINPHFLYNTLDSIKWMAYKIDATDIYNMTTALGKFFRGIISKGKDLVTFQQEIDYLKTYIYIQKIRYQEKFEVVYNIDDTIQEYKTIKLILQPVVENAIIHGLEDIKQGGLITIQGYKKEETIHFEISDNGVGINQDELKSLKEKITTVKASNNEKTSIGLSNVYRRLKLYFGEKGNLEILSEEGKGTIVIFSLPATL